MEESKKDKFYIPNYSHLFNKIKDIKTPIKNNILMAFFDGQWHSELDLVGVTKKQYRFVGAVTLGTMIHSLNHVIKKNYLQKKLINDKMLYKIQDNYIGLTRAAYRFNPKNIL